MNQLLSLLLVKADVGEVDQPEIKQKVHLLESVPPLVLESGESVSKGLIKSIFLV